MVSWGTAIFKKFSTPSLRTSTRYFCEVLPPLSAFDDFLCITAEGVPTLPKSSELFYFRTISFFVGDLNFCSMIFATFPPCVFAVEYILSFLLFPNIPDGAEGGPGKLSSVYD